MTECVWLEVNLTGKSTVEWIMEFEDPSKRWSGIGVMLVAQSLCLVANEEPRKQWVELESTRVRIGTEGIKLEVSWGVKEFRFERADVLRCSSTAALIRSMQPWSSVGARGLLPIFLAPLQRSFVWGLVHGQGHMGFDCSRFCLCPFFDHVTGLPTEKTEVVI